MKPDYRNMPAVLVLISCIAWSCSMGYAQVQTLDESGDASPQATVAPQLPVWTIHPAAEPQPALEIRFWPGRFEMVSGNTFVPFQRAMILLLEGRQHGGSEDPFLKNYDQWMEGPLSELPRQEVSAYLEGQRAVLSEIHRATLMRDSEYQLGIDELRGLEAVQFLLPEFQNMRQLARLLVLEIRLALAEGRLEDAIDSLRVGFRMGEATGSAADLLVSRLVGFAIMGMMLNQVEALVQMPDSPNVYWALASLPESISDIDAAIEFELSITSRVFPQLTELPAHGMEPALWRERLVGAVQDMQSFSGSYGIGSDAQSRLVAGAMIVALAESSRLQLVEQGMAEDQVRAMSPSEAVVRATAAEIRRIQDRFSKWMLLPESMRMEFVERSEAEMAALNASKGQFNNLASTLAGMLLPAVTAAERAGRRTRQTIARLETVEAIRHHAAQHGQLPESLDELSQLPAWPDPFTQRPFGYERESETRAVLRSEPAYPDDPNALIVLKLAAAE